MGLNHQKPPKKTGDVFNRPVPGGVARLFGHVAWLDGSKTLDAASSKSK
jgi:hypothetical protein